MAVLSVRSFSLFKHPGDKICIPYINTVFGKIFLFRVGHLGLSKGKNKFNTSNNVKSMKDWNLWMNR